ncbi:hypothetical protein M758_8G190700 [Ceratodon purpureus]|uniref:Uncharacterized protein n=1 Tax=Ceratodon purpureus TaxID=3225 RepID=A0A8T0H0T2_CERPU|nr:hypothetical protein KC19_8G195700 [Ceratodon purpureus]KAG0609516.1 hypothetical protein M758_8G190700 [Ceratodon purpureus]
MQEAFNADLSSGPSETAPFHIPRPALRNESFHSSSAQVLPPDHLHLVAGCNVAAPLLTSIDAGHRIPSSKPFSQLRGSWAG